MQKVIPLAADPKIVLMIAGLLLTVGCSENLGSDTSRQTAEVSYLIAKDFTSGQDCSTKYASITSSKKLNGYTENVYAVDIALPEDAFDLSLHSVKSEAMICPFYFMNLRERNSIYIPIVSLVIVDPPSATMQRERSAFIANSLQSCKLPTASSCRRAAYDLWGKAAVAVNTVVWRETGYESQSIFFFNDAVFYD